MSDRKRLALVGVGQRGHHFAEALLGPHRQHADLVALCDSSLATLQAWQRELGAEHVSLYRSEDFDRMLEEEQIDSVLVMTPDHTHHSYICAALQAGCDVITEKPLTTDIANCQQIIDAAAASTGSCRVTFNYRYAPWNSAIKQALVDGAIGRITGGTFRHNLGNEHGPYYFHRWHAEARYSGSLLVHKSSHFFDLANWFIGSVPRRVYARGGRHVFTAETAAAWGLDDRAERCPDCPERDRCPFVRFADGNGEADHIESVRLEDTGYSRDLCVFRPEVDIPDVMHVLIEYENGVSFNYQLSAFGSGPSDGILFGTHGSLQTNGSPSPLLRPHYGEQASQAIPVQHASGGHGGADPILYRDLFDPAAPPDPLLRLSDHHAGAWAALIGMAATISMREDRAVRIRDLVQGLDVPATPAMPDQPPGIGVEAMHAWVAAGVAAKRQRARDGKRTMADSFGANG